MKTILITGASSGIGWATAQRLDQKENQLILCGRRKSQLEELAKALNCPTHLLVFDVGNRAEVSEAIASLPEEFSTVDVVINNAGNAHGLDVAHEANLEDWEAMMNSNVMGVLYVTKAILSQMIARKSGHIINVGSIAGKEAYPRGNVYCASKAAVERFTEGLRLDCNPYGIRVGAIHPGLVETDFSNVRFKGDTERAASVYAKLKALTAADVADAIVYMLHTPPHVTVADLTLLPTDQASAFVANRSA
jgi:3-hydroxy acid dehydrogenase/malonic semialdehyde reductase